MPKLKDLNILHIQDGERIQFRTPVNVTKEGLFTTTLPSEAYNAIGAYGMSLCNNRFGKPGYFESTTLEGLQMQIQNLVREALSRTLVEDKTIIKYHVKTRAAYVVDDDGEIIPNGYWRKNHTPGEQFESNWHEGNDNHSTSLSGFTPSLSVYAKPFRKKRYVYKSGKEYIEYAPYEPTKWSRGSSVDWLASPVNVVLDDRFGHFATEKERKRALQNLPEIDATEENAAFFVKMVTFIDKANELFGQLNDPEYVLALLAANKPLQLDI